MEVTFNQKSSIAQIFPNMMTCRKCRPVQSMAVVFFMPKDLSTGPPVVVSGYGFSKCSPKDKFNPDIGYAIALSRAATDAAKKLAKELGIGQNEEGK